jgi:hypothetical protein
LSLCQLFLRFAKARYFQPTHSEVQVYAHLSSYRVDVHVEATPRRPILWANVRFNLRSAWLLQGPGDSSKSIFYLDFLPYRLTVSAKSRNTRPGSRSTVMIHRSLSLVCVRGISRIYRGTTADSGRFDSSVYASRTRIAYNSLAIRFPARHQHQR